MLEGRRVLAVVPARSGSKGIRHKNLQPLRGVSLIGWTGLTLARLPWVDTKVLSTDTQAYVAEGRRYGLDVPFLRPAMLGTDRALAIDVLAHALQASEAEYGGRFDIVLLLEPTSPLREPSDVERTVRRLIATRAPSVVTVSSVPARFHEDKLLTVRGGRLRFLTARGRRIGPRQQLRGTRYWRNGVCYAFTRACVLARRAVITPRTVAEVIDRPVVNIDDPLDLTWAAFLSAQSGAQARLTGARRRSGALAMAGRRAA